MFYIKFFLVGLLQINNNVIDNEIYNENFKKMYFQLFINIILNMKGDKFNMF